MKTISNEKENLIKSLIQIDKMIWMGRTDKTIDVNDLRKERINCVRAIKAMK